VKLRSRAAEIKEPINAAQKVILGNVIVEIEGVKQSVLAGTLLPQHLDVLRRCYCSSDIRTSSSVQWSFSTE